MKIKQLKDYFEAGVITGFDVVRDPIENGWLLVCIGTNGKSWTFETAQGQPRSFAKLDTLVSQVEAISGRVDGFHLVT